MRAPAVPLAAAFVLGMVLPGDVHARVLVPLTVLFLALALGAARAYRLRLGTFTIVTAFVGLGALATEAPLRRTRDRGALIALYGRLGAREFVVPHFVRGTLRREPEERSDRTRLDLDVRQIRLAGQDVVSSGGVSVYVRGERRGRLEHLGAGDRVSLWVRLRRPSSFHNPGGPDGSALLARRRIDFIGSVKSALLVESLDSTLPLLRWASQLRAWSLERLERVVSAESVGIVSALVTGDRTRLEPEVERAFRRAGVFHVMAISGAHVAIWIFALHAGLRRLGLGRTPTLVLLGLWLPAYAAFCGGRAPIVRAVVMASVVIAARLLSLTSPLANGLAVAALALLVWDPRSLGDPGFQLSFAAMGAIALLASALAPRGRFVAALLVSVAAQVGVIPITAFHFHRVSPWAPVASLVAMPVAAAVCVSGALAVALAGVPGVSHLLGFLAGGAASLLLGASAVAAALPGASLLVGAPSAVWLTVYLGAVFLWIARGRRWRTAGYIAWLGLVVQLLLPRTPERGVLEVAALDVGHGDAILVTLPEGQALLVDGGGLPRSTFDVGERVVVPYLLERGLRRLDAVRVTHADFDHIGGLASLVDTFPVGVLWEGAPAWRRRAYRALRRRAGRRAIAFRRLRTGRRFRWGGVDFEVLASGDTDLESANDRSVVLRLSYAGRRILLTGDAESGLERELLERGAELRADVLKLGHHGSRSSTSEAFLEAVRPRIAIVSGRRTDVRPLPSPQVLHRLRRRGVEYARTDRNGAVSVRVYGDGRIELATYRHRSGFGLGPPP